MPSFQDIMNKYEELGGVTWSNIWEWFVYFRFVFNAVFIGFPWTIFLVLSVVWNVVLNAYLNRWWAGGNVYLVANTIFGLI